MSVRVVARIRPLHSSELEKDVIVQAESGAVKIPNPRNDSEAFTFQFNNVYNHTATQQHIFDEEIAPTIKSLFKGVDVTIFAYGVTGTGKTHTMRGGKSLADRGMIPRLLSGIYRRSRKIEKDSAGATTVAVSMSYYEIYCDRVYDLFEGPEKRTPAGLPIRDNGGKTVVVGLTERPCTTLKDFEQSYDQANINRSTSATKLNAHSSRSHAVLSVKITQTTGHECRVSTVSAIDLAGSEDNRRTDNGKERMVESAAINKSLFVLAQCVEAISRKQARIPYRESRMTRILSLGQNNGITIMILQLAPIRSYHLDTLSSLNFANRTKKIEVNEVENQPIYRDTKSVPQYLPTAGNLHRQPLRPKALAMHAPVPRDASGTVADPPVKPIEKTVKAFAVFTDKSRAARTRPVAPNGPGNECGPTAALSRSIATTKPSTVDGLSRGRKRTVTMTQESIEALIDRKVAEKLAVQTTLASRDVANHEIAQQSSAEVQARLDALERRLGAPATEQSEGLQFLLMGKQHLLRGEDTSALKMFQLALPYFPDNQKLLSKIENLKAQVAQRSEARESRLQTPRKERAITADRHNNKEREVQQVPLECEHAGDITMQGEHDAEYTPSDSEDDLAHALTRDADATQTPRTKNLLKIINTRDVAQIRLLKGVGAKKAEAIVNALCTMTDATADEIDAGLVVRDLDQLGRLRGVGIKGVEKMRVGLVEGV